jgi:hypothetical protein
VFGHAFRVQYFAILRKSRSESKREIAPLAREYRHIRSSEHLGEKGVPAEIVAESERLTTMLKIREAHAAA